MSVLGAIIDWGNPEPPIGPLGALLSALPERSPDGRWFARVPHGVFGIARRFVRRAEKVEVQPLVDFQRRLCAVGDIRLDNRDELRNALGDCARATTSDVSLLLVGYDCWGSGLAERLVGDFAFVIWDWRRKEIYAARDPFGVRSLVYRLTPNNVVFATDAAQLLALSETDRTPDDQTVVDALAWSHAHYGPTYFRGIRSVQPGHYLIGSENGTREREYFLVPDTPSRYARPEEYYDQFRALFRQAVEDRLDSEYPIVAHLSGGLDSSSIVCMADRIYADGRGRSPLVMASAVFPGQPPDETPYIDVVARSVRFPSHRWSGLIPSGREFSVPSLSIPGSSVNFNGGSAGDIEIARSQGSRVILAGEGGDFVTGEIDLFSDLLVNRRWLALAQQIAVASSHIERDRRIVLLKQAIKGECPRWVVDVWNLKNPRPMAPPEWLRRELHPRWIDRRTQTQPLPGQWLSRIQRGCWQFLRGARMAWITDHMGAYAADAGLEIRFPFLDARLVRFVLSIPFEHRLVGGLRRWMHRQALRGILPDAIAQRQSKRSFTYAVVRWGHESAHGIRELVEGTEWVSDRFISQRKVRELFHRLVAKPVDKRDWEDWRSIRSIVNIETWQRAVLRYPPAQESLPMSDIGSDCKQQDGEAPRSKEILPYVSPTLTGIGNVRELLASDPGSSTESGVQGFVFEP